MPPNVSVDAQRVLDTLINGGIAIIPSSVGYGIVANDPCALARIYTVKQRAPHKRHAVIGSYALHHAIHLLPLEKQELTHMLTVTLDVPLGVIAPYRADHPLLRSLDVDTLSQSSVGDTIAMLVNGGPFQEELVRLATAAGKLVLGSSANLSGRGTKTAVEDIEEDVQRAADVVVDYGRVRHGMPRASSTMVDVGKMELVRFGACYEVIRDVMKRFYGVCWPEDPGRQMLFSGRLSEMHRIGV